MSRRASRERAEQAVIMRARGATFQEIADALGYASRASAERAVSMELRRTSPTTPDDARKFLLASARDTTAKWAAEFEAAYGAKDVERMAEAHRAICRDRELSAKVSGAFAPVDVRVGISAEQFGQQAAQIIETLGADRALRALAEAPGVAAALPAATRAAVFAERVEPVEDDGEPWANIGLDQPPRAMHATYDSRTGTGSATWPLFVAHRTNQAPLTRVSALTLTPNRRTNPTSTSTRSSRSSRSSRPRSSSLCRRARPGSPPSSTRTACRLDAPATAGVWAAGGSPVPGSDVNSCYPTRCRTRYHQAEDRKP